MCKLIKVNTNYDSSVMVADYKAEIIRHIISTANKCPDIDAIMLFGSVLEERCKEKSDIEKQSMRLVIENPLTNL